jgi:hypothetical protein
MSGQDASEVAMRLGSLRAEFSAQLCLRQKQELAMVFPRAELCEFVSM